MARCDTKLSRALLCLLVQFSIGSLAVGQDVVVTNHDPNRAADAEIDPERLPKFRIEIVVFAYNAFDPTEEEFGNKQETLNSDSLSAPRDRPSNDAAELPVSEVELPEQNGQWASDNDLKRSPEAPFQFEMLGPSDLTLTAACDKLERLDAYTVLVHGGWIQEGLPEQEAHGIDMSLFGEPTISGTLQFHVNRFAHLAAALDYHASADQSLPPEAERSETGGKPMNPSGSFELRQTRRIRSGELHYLDHPAFGLLVVVRPHDEGREDKIVSSGDSEGSFKPAA